MLKTMRMGWMSMGGVSVTCCVLIPDFDGAVMGGCGYPSCAIRSHRQKHAAGCGLKVASVLHNFTARLAQIPELMTQTQIHCEQNVIELSKQSEQGNRCSLACFLPLIQIVGAAASARKPRLQSPQPGSPAPPGESQGIPRPAACPGSASRSPPGRKCPKHLPR